MNAPAKDVDTYLDMQPEEMRPILDKMRALIQATAPKAEEYIGYGMPMYKQNGMLVSFAAAKQHIGFYPCNSTTVNDFKEELKAYGTSKGAIRFPLDKPLPVTLIKKIIKTRIKENEEKAKLKAAKGKK